jgi:hypothetical protein
MVSSSGQLFITASSAIGGGGANLSGGTERYIPLWTGSSTLTTSSLYQDTSNRIGIRTTSPSGALEINSSQGFHWNTYSSASVIVGNRLTGSSFITYTPGTSSAGNVFDCGFAVDGTNSGGIGNKATINLTAFGVYSGGGYHSDMVFRNSHNTTLYEVMRLSYSGSNPTVYITGSLRLSGSSHTISGSLNAPNITGSLLGTSSWANNATTSSYISTLKAGSGSVASFAGLPLSSSITFGTAFANNLYAVTVTGEDARSWTIQSKTSAGFTINSNSIVALTGPVYWIATPFN